MEKLSALALAGGSRYGAFQAGVLPYLKEHDLLCGVSVGAMHALNLAQYESWEEGTRNTLKIWGGINDRAIYKHHLPLGPAQGVFPCTKATSLYNTSPLQALIRSNYHGKLVRPVRIGAVSLTTLEYKLFDEHSPDIVGATIGSSAMPLFFEPWEIEGDLYCDGGIRRVTPIRAALDAGATEITVIINEPLKRKFNLPRPKTTQDAGLRFIQTMVHEVFVADIKLALAYNQLAARGDTGRREISITIIEPPEPLPGSPLDFSPEIIEKTISIGEAVGMGLSG